MRGAEIESISNAASLKTVNLVLAFVSGPLVYLATFVTFLVTTGGDGSDGLTPARVFTTISLFGAVRFALTSALPYAVEKLAESQIAVNRLEAYLLLPELTATEAAAASASSSSTAKPAPIGSIEMRHASFSWVSPKAAADAGGATPSDADVGDALPPVILRDVSFSIRPGSLVAVVGPVGCGKSSLLAAILGEMSRVASSSSASFSSLGGRCSITTQKAWIFGGSVQDNIVFHRPFDRARYERTLRACQLTTDINLLHAGDATIIGERGVNLSGGQRARVSLARAVYDTDATDVFLLDDPLAAVDASVGARLFRYVIGRGRRALLRGKTRVLVTHHTHFLPRCDHIIILNGGAVAFSGSHAELVRSGIDVDALVPTTPAAKAALDAAASEAAKAQSSRRRRADSRVSDGDSQCGSTPASPQLQAAAPSTVIHDEGDDDLEDDDQVSAADAEAEYAASMRVPIDIRTDKLDELSITMAEGKQTGSVGIGIVPALADAAGGPMPLLGCLALFVLCQANANVCDWYFAYWSRLSFAEQHHLQNYWVYALLVFGVCVLGALRTRYFFTVLLRAASELHARMFKGVLYAPMRFFESQPSGRVLNRCVSSYVSFCVVGDQVLFGRGSAKNVFLFFELGILGQ